MNEKKASDFNIRLLTAVGIVILTIGLLMLSKWSAISFILCIGLASSIEHLNLSRDHRVFNIGISILMTGLLILLMYKNPERIKTPMLTVSLICSAIGILGLFWKEILVIHKRMPVSINLATFLFPTFLLSYWIYQQEQYDYKYILSFVLLVWVNDTFAYLVGRKLGKTKLFQSVSPNKTWEGFFGGLVFTLILSIILNQWIDTKINIIFAMAFIASVLGTIGDLVQSSVKRYFTVKDSGNALPGHGGFWDRYDSFIFICPYIYLLYTFFEI